MIPLDLIMLIFTRADFIILDTLFLFVKFSQKNIQWLLHFIHFSQYFLTMYLQYNVNDRKANELQVS